MNRIETQFTASLHTHVRSQFDAQIFPDELVKRIQVLNGEGCAITDHGVLSSIEDYRPYFKEAGLKLIPGVELYVDGGILGRLHLVVLAMNDTGYHGICKIVTESNKNLINGYPVITQEKLFEMMKEYRGSIIALSACMQGVIAATFLQNETVSRQIKKLEEKQKKYPAENKFESVLCSTEKSLEAAIIKRDAAQREKSPELELLKANVAEIKKQLTVIRKDFKAEAEKIETYQQLNKQIEDLQKEIKKDQDLYKIAKETAKEYIEAFGKENFYIELQYHGIEEEKICFPKIRLIAEDLDLKVVATNDVHILQNTEDERLRRQILRSLRFGECFEEENIGDAELYLKDNYELAEWLKKILDEDTVIQAINNIKEVFDRCNVDFSTGKHYPKFTY